MARRTRPKARVACLEPVALAFQPLESRQMLYGFIQAQNDPMSSGGYSALNTTTFTMAAPGVLTGVSGSSPLFTAHLATGACKGACKGDGSNY